MASTLPWSLVSVVRSELRDGKTLYVIEVKPANEDEKVFFLRKRYNMFAHLRDELKNLLKGKARSPFPPKTETNIDMRRRMLDDWLAEVVSFARDEFHAALRPLLYEFLSERTAEINLYQTSLLSTDNWVNAVKMPLHEERDGTTWFALDVCCPDNEVFRIWKTYSMFAHFQADVGFNPQDFPKKSLTKCTGDALSDRRRQLDYWFTQLINSSDTDLHLKHKVRAFLLPSDPAVLSDSEDEARGESGKQLEIVAARLSAVGERGGTVYYKVEVVPADESEAPYCLWKRYNMFSNLCDAAVAATGDSTVADDFPSKALAKGDKGVDQRKKALDFWLTTLFDAAKTTRGEALRPLLRRFLHESEKMTPDFDSSSGTEITSVSLPSYHDRQGTIFYKICCHLSTGEDFDVAKSYSMFHELAKKCAQTSLGPAALNGLPAKTLMKVTSKDALNQRLEALSEWFVSMFKRSGTQDYADLKPLVREFLDSSHV